MIDFHQIKNKKTFWMNLALSLFATFGAFMFFLVNIDYVEARPSEKVFNLLFWTTPVLTMVTLYRDDRNILLKLSLALNLIYFLFFGYYALRLIYIHQYLVTIPMLIFMIPFGINIKQLLKMKANLA
jgi:uncharacterized membrane protein YccF (DUF307 family)